MRPRVRTRTDPARRLLASVCIVALVAPLAWLAVPAARAAEPPRPLRDDEGSLLNAVDAANRSIVTVVGYPMRYGPPRPGEKLRRLIGTAVAVADDQILTTASMALPGGTLSVLLGKGVEREARLLGVDRTSNLALFEVKDASLPALRRAPPQSLAVGAWVAVISNVSITRPQAALGRVLGRGERIDFPHAGDVVEIDAPSFLGSTGAAVLNEDGEWIALVVGRAQPGASAPPEGEPGGTGTGDVLLPQPNNLLLALPVDEVDRISSDLARYGAVRHAFLGVGLVVGSEEDTLGVRVVKVWPASPADSAGLRVGDRILAMEGREMRRPDEITTFVRSMRPGDTIGLTILRDTDILPLRVTLGLTESAAGSARESRAEQIRTLRRSLDSLRHESYQIEERLKALESPPRR